MALSFNEIGGYSQLEYQYRYNSTPAVHVKGCGEPRDDFFHVFRDPLNSDLPWPAMLIGITINSVWYWCTDQVIVQRTLAAKTLSHAKGGCIMAGLIKILPMYMMVMVGMISRIKFTDIIGCADPDVCEQACGSRTSCTNYAYSLLVLEIMPTGARGLLLAVMIAALMSSLTSVFNSGSTLFTCDLWVKMRPKAKNRELMIVGRLFILVLCGASIAWVPIIKAFSDGELFNYIQSITSFLAPPITAIFSICILWPRLNEPASFWGLVLGMFIGLVRMLMEFAVPASPCGSPDRRPEIVTKVHYLYFSMISVACTTAISVIIAYATPPIDQRCLTRLTWWTRFSQRKRFPISNKVKFMKNIDGNSMNEDDEKSSIESEDFKEPDPDRPWWKKGIALFCGLDEQPKAKMTEEEERLMKLNMMNIEEKKSSALIVNCAAVLMGCACCFLFGYYA